MAALGWVIVTSIAVSTSVTLYILWELGVISWCERRSR